jgi:site-specific DNA recombinase
MTTTTGPIDIYARQSRDDDERQRSPEGQIADCRVCLADRGLSEGIVHVDPGQSAWNPRIKRDGWDALMKRLESGEAAGVIVWDLERFSRRPRDGERLIDAAGRGLLVLDSDSSYDLMSASGRKAFRDQLTTAAYYSDRLSGRVKRGKRLKAIKGEVSCRRPFGFEPDGITQRPAEAAIVREMTARFLAGESQDAMVASLNARGITTSQGKAWTRTGLRQLLTRQRNAGHLVHHGVIVAALPGGPLIDPDDHKRVLAQFAAKRPGRPPSPAYLCSGVALCALCMHRLAGRPRANMLPYPDGSVRRQYQCSPSGKGGCGKIAIDQRGLDEAAAALVDAIMSDPRHASQIEAAAARAAERAAELDMEIAGAEETALKLADRLGRGEITLDRYDAATAPLDKRLAALRAARAALSDPAMPAVPKQGNGDWARRWKAADPAERRTLLRMALRGRALIVGPADPADRTNVTRRVTIGDPA